MKIIERLGNRKQRVDTSKVQVKSSCLVLMFMLHVEGGCRDQCERITSSGNRAVRGPAKLKLSNGVAHWAFVEQVLRERGRSELSGRVRSGGLIPMSGQSSECGGRGKPEKTGTKGRVKNTKRGADVKLEKGVNSESVKTSMRNDRSDALLDSNETPKLADGTIEPGVHRAKISAPASTSGSRRRPEASSPRVDQLAGASTSMAARRSILREKDSSTSSPEPNRFVRIRQLWARYPLKKSKKSIVFVDQRMSDTSLESVVTLMGTSRPLPKSALRSTGSIRSVSSSVRFSLPPETLREEDSALMKIGNWDIVCDVGNDEITDGSTARWRTFTHTRLCRIAMCLALGLIVPSFLVVPVLVYEDISNEATP